MKSKQKKVNKKHCLLVLGIVIALIIIANSGKNNKEYELSILLNNELIKTKNDVLIEEENIFFSKEDIQEIFDDTIYYNEAEKELITTHNKHIALLKVDENYALINDENIELNGTLKEKDDTVYLPITDLQEVYDIELRFSQKNNRIIIDSTQNKKVEATIQKRTCAKKKRGLFSKRIEKLIIGDKVIILEDDGKYRKIQTPLGNIGYIKTNKMSEENIIREDVIEDKKVLQVYKNYSNISGIYENIKVDDNKLNVVIPTFFYIDKNNKVLDKSLSSTATYAVYNNWTNNNKLIILPTLTNNESVSSSLLSYSQRSQVAMSLVNLLKEHDYIGVNIKFGTIDDINSYYRFIIELAPRLKTAGLELAVTLDKNINREKIENIVDYIIEE